MNRYTQDDLRRDFKKVCEALQVEPLHLDIQMGISKSFYEWVVCQDCGERYERVVIGFCDDIHCSCRSDHNIRKRLIHEVLHKKGLDHCAKARRRGFYAVLNRDELSEKIAGWIFDGEEFPVELKELGLTLLEEETT